MKTVAYMINMANVSRENDKDNASELEVDLILKTAKELDVDFDEVVDDMSGDNPLVPSFLSD